MITFTIPIIKKLDPEDYLAYLQKRTKASEQDVKRALERADGKLTGASLYLWYLRRGKISTYRKSWWLLFVAELVFLSALAVWGILDLVRNENVYLPLNLCLILPLPMFIILAALEYRFLNKFFWSVGEKL